jgi:hypothetical protein
MAERTAKELLLATLIRAKMFDDDAPLLVPVQGTCIIKRVQDPEGDLTAHDRNADAAKTLAQLVKKPRRIGILKRFAG